MDRHYRIHLYFLAVDEDLLGMVERRRSRRSRRGTFPASDGQLGLLLGLAHHAVGCVELNTFIIGNIVPNNRHYQQARAFFEQSRSDVRAMADAMTG
jgi:hypothetical protein